MKIVVGIDGSEASSDALRYAHGEAVSSGAELVAVTVWEVPVMAAAYITTEEVDGAMDPWMEGFIAEVLGEDGAAVKRAPASGSAAAALLEEAEDADTLIVGTRGHALSPWCRRATVPPAPLTGPSSSGSMAHRTPRPPCAGRLSAPPAPAWAFGWSWPGVVRPQVGWPEPKCRPRGPRSRTWNNRRERCWAR